MSLREKYYSLVCIYSYKIVCILIASYNVAPSAAPERFVGVAGERQVNFSWSPPPVTEHNGVIIGYTLSCSPSPSSLPLSLSQAGIHTVSGFTPDTEYTCSVVAHNDLGPGPAAHETLTTLEDCKSISTL